MAPSIIGRSASFLEETVSRYLTRGLHSTFYIPKYALLGCQKAVNWVWSQAWAWMRAHWSRHHWPGLSSASRRPVEVCTTTQAQQRLTLVPETKAPKIISVIQKDSRPFNSLSPLLLDRLPSPPDLALPRCPASFSLYQFLGNICMQNMFFEKLVRLSEIYGADFYFPGFVMAGCGIGGGWSDWNTMRGLEI